MPAVKTNLPKPLVSVSILSLAFTAGCYNMPAGDPFDPGGEPMSTKPSLSAGIAAIANGPEALGDIFAPLFDENPSYYANLMVAEDSTSDERIQGISRIPDYGFGRGEPYTDAYATLASSGESDLVRATAIRAINRSGDATRSGLLVTALADESTLVRLEAAKALGNLPDPAAVGPLLQSAGGVDENLDVRLASVDALRHYPQNSEVIDRLIALLEGDVFDLAFQARASLAVLFGRDLGYDAAAWRAAAPSEPAA